ncbi:hypothetical protein KR093_006337 [Drosophila rubida]|uniref:MYCBP-associated protein n=1 Tax=Drosophila rubida TaxID=30044 RepID=A0AAD4K047_9MUSC|nr:hypothetical protein KR093_006337 [Drosophila rubida]
MNLRNAKISNVNLLSETDLHNGQLQTGEKLVHDIVDDIFEFRRYYYDGSNSEDTPESLPRSSKLFVDRRLKYWKNMLQQRRSLQSRLSKETGKQPQDILFTMDFRKEGTMKRALPCSYECGEKNSSNSDDFKMKRGSYIEIVGTPRRMTKELLSDGGGKSSRVSKWTELSQRIRHCTHAADQFAPDIQRLEMIGKNIWSRVAFGHDSLHTISSPTTSSKKLSTSRRSTQTKSTMTATLSILINGTRYTLNDPDYSPILEKMFVCNPFEYHLRTIIIIENNGQRPINFFWKPSQFFAYNDSLFIGRGDEFIFDTMPFQLRSGEVHKVTILFRPITVGIVKQRWMLSTRPRIFHSFPCALTLNMHGRCKPPQEYLEHMESLMKVPNPNCPQVSVSQMHKQLARSIWHSEITSACPFSRELEDREAFNQRNVGFHCDRASDLVFVKDFFERCKPTATDIEWDFSVSMLIDLVCYTEKETQRFELFAELQTILGKLRGRTLPLSLDDDPAKLAERRRTRFIFVRGIIANNIELWEEKIWTLGSQMLKSSECKAVNKLIISKPFRDSIYIYTYHQLCNAVEDIVSVIESTEHV